MTATTPTSDIRQLAVRLRDLVRGLVLSSPLVYALAITPVPASRPRVTRWGTHYGKTYERFRREGMGIADGLPEGRVEGPAIMYVEHVVKRPKTSKRDYPQGDVDNYTKSTLDLLTKAGRAYSDDDQVVALVAVKRFAEEGEEPTIHVDAYPLDLKIQ